MKLDGGSTLCGRNLNYKPWIFPGKKKRRSRHAVKLYKTHKVGILSKLGHEFFSQGLRPSSSVPCFLMGAEEEQLRESGEVGVGERPKPISEAQFLAWKRQKV